MKIVGLIKELEPESPVLLPSLGVLRGQLDPESVDRVSAYLQAGEIVSDVMQFCTDPLNSSVRIPGGSGLQSDGVWVWRQDLYHYVESYHIALPQEFVAHIFNGSISEYSEEQCDEAMQARSEALFPKT